MAKEKLGKRSILVRKKQQKQPHPWIMRFGRKKPNPYEGF